MRSRIPFRKSGWSDRLFGRFGRAISAVSIAELVSRLLLYALAAVIARRHGYMLQALAALSVAQAAVGFALVAGDGGLSLRGVGEIARGERPAQIVRRIAPQQVLLSTVSVALVLAFVWVMAYPTPVRVSTLALTPLPIVYALNTNYVLLGTRRFRALAKSRILGTSVTVAVGLAALIANGPLWVLASAYWIGPLAATVAAAVYCRGEVHVRDMFQFRVPDLFHRDGMSIFVYAISVHLIANLPLLILGLTGSSSELIRFTVALRLLLLEFVPVQIAASVLIPEISEDTHEAIRVKSKAVYGAALLGLVMGVCVLVTARSLPVLLFGREASGAAGSMRICSLVIPLTYVAYLMQETQVVQRRIRFAVASTLANLIVLVVVATATPLGRSATGMAWDLVLGSASALCVIAFSGEKLSLTNHWRTSVLPGAAFAATAVAAVTLSLESQSISTSIGAETVMCAAVAFLGALWWHRTSGGTSMVVHPVRERD